jgi:hypothetical protein
MPLGKRKTGADDGQTDLDELDELSHDMAVACNINDYATATRVYDRFLSVLQPDADLPPLDAIPLDARQEEDWRRNNTVRDGNSTRAVA